MNQKIFEAEQIMKEAHNGQTRWDGVTPYHVHPQEVVRILSSWNITDEDMLITGFLHDVLEDTDFSPKVIFEKFGSKVKSLVTELTFEKGSEDFYLKQVAKLSREAKIIKMADITANLLDGKEKKSKRFVDKRTRAIQVIMKDLLNPE